MLSYSIVRRSRNVRKTKWPRPVLRFEFVIWRIFINSRRHFLRVRRGIRSSKIVLNNWKLLHPRASYLKYKTYEHGRPDRGRFKYRCREKNLVTECMLRGWRPQPFLYGIASSRIRSLRENSSCSNLNRCSRFSSCAVVLRSTFRMFYTSMNIKMQDRFVKPSLVENDYVAQKS